MSENLFVKWNLKTYKIYPKFIHTLIVRRYLEEAYRDDGEYEKQIDDKIYKFTILNNNVVECEVKIEEDLYDYFLSGYSGA